MVDNIALPPAPAVVRMTPCRAIGRFIAKGGAFALHAADGADVWLEIDPVPLHLIDETVEITGQRHGQDLIAVEGIGPVRRLS